MEFLVYGKPNCPYCEQAKDLLIAKGVDFVYYSLDQDFTVPDLIEMVIEKTGVRPSTFPQIFVRDDEDADTAHVGGFTELRVYLVQVGE